MNNGIQQINLNMVQGCVNYNKKTISEPEAVYFNEYELNFELFHLKCELAQQCL